MPEGSTIIPHTEQCLSPRHAEARRLAAAGIRVFAVEVDGKHPRPGSHGEHDATTDLAIIDGWWGEADYNLALPPGPNGWGVVDLDGAEGLENWFRLECDNGWQATKIVETPGGGRHLYFRGELPASASKLAPKIDTRGVKGYVLVPPSVIDGRSYEVIEDREPAALPAWIPERLASFKRDPVPAPEGVELDMPVNVARAREWLRGQPVPVDGAGSDAATFKLAAMLKDTGVSLAVACELLEEKVPDFDPEWILEKVEHAYRYRQNEAGAYAATDGTWMYEAAQKWIDENPEPQPAEAKFEGPLVWGAELRGRQFEQPEWVWQDRLMAYEPNLFTGAAGVGKTTFAENLAVAVAAGIPFLGAPTKPMHVMVMVAEDTYGPVIENLKAIRGAFGVEDHQLDGRIHLMSVKSDPYHHGHLLARISDDGEVCPTPFMTEVVTPYLVKIGEPTLWIVDPLAEFVRFNNLNETACRVLATTFLADVCRLNGRRVTPLVNDHPSKASMNDRSYVAGSPQLKAAFTFVATLRLPDKPARVHGHKELVFDVLKGRYAAETQTTLYRAGACPAFFIGAAAAATLADIKLRVYAHIWHGRSKGRGFRKDGRGSTDLFGPLEIGQDLELSEQAVKAAVDQMLADRWLRSEKASGGGKQGHVPAHLEIGPKAPPTSEWETQG